MNKLYRLSFTTQKDWQTLRDSLIEPDQLIKKVSTLLLLTGETITVNEVGSVPIPLEYNEDGEPLTEQLYHTDWAVDVDSKVLIPELNRYIIRSNPVQFYNYFAGERELVKAVPTEDWLKAEIQEWLTANNIEWNKSMLKSELLNLV